MDFYNLITQLLLFLIGSISQNSARQSFFQSKLIEVIFVFFKTPKQLYYSQTIMHHISHLSQFNLRSTMPTFPTRNHKKIGSGRAQKHEALSSNSHGQNSPSEQSYLTSFFVRITKENLEQQNRIYKWRMNCSGNFIGIQSIKLQSQGNCYNPNYLFKVDLSISKSNFVQVKDLCLTKCVSLLKSVLVGAKNLFQYFQPIAFTQKMIYISEKGQAKIWMDQRYYVNPNNQIYYKKVKQLTVQDSLRSILAIFQLKCLKTKLSSKMFKILAHKFTLEGALLAIENFQYEQNLFPIQGLKNSISTGTAINTSFSLQFSVNKSSIRRYQTNKRNQNRFNLKRQGKTGNIASNKFMQAKSMELIPGSLSIPKKEMKNIYKSQQQNADVGLRKSNNVLSEINQKKIDNSNFSVTSSEMFNESVSNFRLGHKQNSGGSVQATEAKNRLFESQKINSNNGKKKEKILESSIFGNQCQKNPEIENVKTIISKNGWSANILTLFDRKNLKQSFSEGKDQNLYLRDFKLKKLHTMGKEVTQSFLPVHEQSEQN